jgi:hypothetical protein
VPKVMNPHIVESGSRSDALPGLLNADEMSFAALGRSPRDETLHDLGSRLPSRLLRCVGIY